MSDNDNAPRINTPGLLQAQKNIEAEWPGHSVHIDVHAWYHVYLTGTTERTVGYGASVHDDTGLIAFVGNVSDPRDLVAALQADAAARAEVVSDDPEPGDGVIAIVDGEVRA